MRLFLAALTLAAASALAAAAAPALRQPAQATSAGRLTPDQVAKRMQDRDTGRDSRSTMRMKLYDRRGRVRERVLTLTTLRGRGAAGVPATAPDGDRLLIRFSYPSDIRGTSFLVWEHADSEDERFLYLPSLGRVRRIAGAETQESFVGSDFTYEDFGGRELDEYTYGFSGAEGENAAWTPAGGAPRPAWRLESRRKDAAAEFPRAVSLVLKDSFIVVQADVYNRRNEKQKIYNVRRLDQVEGIWTAMDAEMSNTLEKTRTELLVEAADYNVGLKEADFSRRELERGAGSLPLQGASEPCERATPPERAGEAARESACRGVQGAKPLGS
jgi:hypothetical protein